MSQRCFECNRELADDPANYRTDRRYCGKCLAGERDDPAKSRRQPTPPEVTLVSEEALTDARHREERENAAQAEIDRANALADAHEQTGNPEAARNAREAGARLARNARNSATRLVGPDGETVNRPRSQAQVTHSDPEPAKRD